MKLPNRKVQRARATAPDETEYLLSARAPLQPLVGRRRTAPAVTTPPPPSAATRRSAAAAPRSCRGDMRYVPPHCSARRPLSRPALPPAPTAQAPAPTLPQRE